MYGRRGRVNTVVANAGSRQRSLGTITEDQLDHIFKVDVKGVLFSVQQALALMPPTGQWSSSDRLPPCSPRPP